MPLSDERFHLKIHNTITKPRDNHENNNELRSDLNSDFGSTISAGGRIRDSKWRFQWNLYQRRNEQRGLHSRGRESLRRLGCNRHFTLHLDCG